MERKKIGLALGSGAFRGFAHIGIIRSLSNHGIPVDYISGASIGSLVAAHYALYGEVESLIEKMTSGLAKKIFTLSNLGFRGGVVGMKRFSLLLDELFGDREFSDTRMPLYIISTDLVTGQAVIMDRGQIATAVKASCSIPVVFAPVSYDGRPLVDGGLSNPLPAAVLRRAGADKIIGVNLYHDDEFGETRFNLATIAGRSVLITLRNLSRHDEKDCDLVINPNASSFTDSLRLKRYLVAEAAAKVVRTAEETMDEKVSIVKGWLKL